MSVIDSLGFTESGNNYNAYRQNDDEREFYGKYQFGVDRLNDLGMGRDFTLDEFTANTPEGNALQEEVMRRHVTDYRNRIESGPLANYIGQRVNGVPLSMDGMIAVAHLGGFDGLTKFVESGGAYNPKDEEGTSLADYNLRHTSNPSALSDYAESARRSAQNASTEFMNARAADEQTNMLTAALFANEDEMLKAAGLYDRFGDQIQKPKPLPYPVNFDVTTGPVNPDWGMGGPEYGAAAAIPVNPDWGMGGVVEPVTQNATNITNTSTATAAEEKDEDEDDPWNWQLSLFEGLEGLGVGLGQMSRGQPVDMTAAWRRQDAVKEAQRRSEIDEYNALTQRMQEQRLAEKAALDDVPINRMAVAQAARDAGLPASFVNTIEQDESGFAAKQAAEFLFSPQRGETVDYSDPATRQAVADEVRRLNPNVTDTLYQRIAQDPDITALYAEQLPSMKQQRTPDQMIEETETLRDQVAQMQLPAATAQRVEQGLGLMGIGAARGDTDLYNKGLDSVTDAIQSATGKLETSEINYTDEEIDRALKQRERARVAEGVRNLLSPDDPRTEAFVTQALSSDNPSAVMSEAIEYAQSQEEQAEKDASNAARMQAADMMQEASPLAAQLMREGSVAQAMQQYEQDTGSQLSTKAQFLEDMLNNPDLYKMQLEIAATEAGTPNLASEAAYKALEKQLEASAERMVSRRDALNAAEEITAFLVDNPDVKQGSFAGLSAKAAGYIKDTLGLDIAGDLSAQRVLDAMFVDLARNRRIPGEGAASNYDQELYQRSGPRIENPRLSNLILSQANKRNLELDLLYSDFERQWYGDPEINGGNPLDPRARDKWINEQLGDRFKGNSVPVYTMQSTERAAFADEVETKMAEYQEIYGDNYVVQFTRPDGYRFYAITGVNQLLDDTGKEF